MYQQILVAIDLSDESNLVLEKATALAKEYNAALDVVHVLDWPLTGFDPVVGFSVVSDDSMLQEMTNSVQKFVEKYGIDAAHTHTLLGQPSSMVAHLSEQLNADLLVVGSHGRRGWRALLGSTANAIVHVIQCDCLVVRIKS
ncbi:MAG: universal stress protein [Cellvibrionales bacterium]|jgi:universal stress protein A|nr:universal stress protein [Cellvibrionales bacterium]MBK8675593.1 universal stress protein [Cellvibrionales bacterium]HRF88286.1 universal stress protein [Pseudomonadales bacterium]HRG51112.1 universal stress protein [Pseudomonadales bacterium]